MQPEVFQQLVRRYNKPVPRYTSYPTVPVWKENIDQQQYIHLLQQQFQLHNHKEGISLYIHLPFCESLCTYCGCNKKITTNHSVEEEYLGMIEKEFQLYLSLLPEKPVIRELHLGGGTPTFFSPANLERLIHFITGHSTVHPHHEFSIEGHPNNTTKEHLETLYNLGFRRISYGVQDNDPEVQRIINRIQPLENVQRATEEARAIGFVSVNYDLIYGLPKQTLASITRTIEEVIALRPDRIAFYSYAHVPWTSRGQRLFDENDLPSPEEKLQLYLKGKELLTAAGYIDIGMDHFALPNDELFLAWETGKLHRNFMGYTTQHTSMLLGLGVSSISDIGVAFGQNKKSLHEYYECIQRNELPIFKGYFLSEEDKAFRKYILGISCRGYAVFRREDQRLIHKYVLPQLQQPLDDGLIYLNEDGLVVTEKGRQFIRNICSAFDLYLQRDTVKPMFSKAI
ncbi:oxygen-independent coproporphyrinogen-3 oxidase [Lacibacter cauensis]|uniref:Coproporphyrinogen-III oxidase n=1 Tax=Lacibacter cauensis TaxID=510947 RepID=A0A562SR37_9BACT|nr:oxygen-independent coproporphyrinogen III oxidase [Lacibacter cauensis]TWI83598.1 oxygen-independent coproporphyrinogen-3 oxidase [Lacibacter cauensis]